MNVIIDIRLYSRAGKWTSSQYLAFSPSKSKVKVKETDLASELDDELRKELEMYQQDSNIINNPATKNNVTVKETRKYSYFTNYL